MKHSCKLGYHSNFEKLIAKNTMRDNFKVVYQNFPHQTTIWRECLAGLMFGELPN